ncbi:MAG: hypothetical protein ACQESK_07030 [Bacteroidota bacterium]
MNDKNKHIDRIFQEKFKDFEPKPSDKVWNNIAQNLGHQKTSAGSSFWQKAVGIAALIAIILSLFSIYKSYNQSPATKIVYNNQLLPQFVVSNADETQNSNETNNQINPSNQSVFITKTSAKNSTQKSTIQQQSSSTANKSIDYTSVFSTLSSSLYDLTREISRTFVRPENLTLRDIVFQSSDKTAALQLEDLDENEVEKDDNQDLPSLSENESNWQVSPNVAPIFAGSTAGNNSLGEQFSKNQTTSDVSFSYGLKVAYQVNNKLKIRSGINSINMGMNTQDAVIAAASGPSANSNVALHTNAQNVTVYSQDQFQREVGDPQTYRAGYDEGSLTQQIGFLEIPVEFEYALLDKKIGLHIIGGASTFFLQNNEVLFNSNFENASTSLGQASNVNQTSFSTNFGVGLNYNFAKNFNFNLEPTLKYQINTFDSSTTNFKPYFFGVYSGVSYRF